MSEIIKNRYDFVYLFDIKDGNPNGDPDAGNLPRIDPETGHGLVTDVCLKRKVRNYVQITKPNDSGYDIYIKEKAVLGRAHVEAFNKIGINIGQETEQEIEEETYKKLEEIEIPSGLDKREADGKYYLKATIDIDKKNIKDWLNENNPDEQIKNSINELMDKIKSRKPNGEEVEKGRQYMCKTYYDIRTFGAVMSLKSAPNCGQVRGPVQFTFARSIDQVVPLEYSITRMAVATEAEAEKQQGDNRTMGRKFTIPYGLFRTHGFVSAPFAEQTGFSEEDLELFWQALVNMFELDHSAARGHMAARKLIIFKHQSPYGNAPAHQLFDMVKVKTLKSPARDFNDYQIILPEKNDLPENIEMIDYKIFSGTITGNK